MAARKSQGKRKKTKVEGNIRFTVMREGWTQDKKLRNAPPEVLGMYAYLIDKLTIERSDDGVFYVDLLLAAETAVDVAKASSLVDDLTDRGLVRAVDTGNQEFLLKNFNKYAGLAQMGESGPTRVSSAFAMPVGDRPHNPGYLLNRGPTKQVDDSLLRPRGLMDQIREEPMVFKTSGKEKPLFDPHDFDGADAGQFIPNFPLLEFAWYGLRWKRLLKLLKNQLAGYEGVRIGDRFDFRGPAGELVVIAWVQLHWDAILDYASGTGTAEGRRGAGSLQTFSQESVMRRAVAWWTSMCSALEANPNDKRKLRELEEAILEVLALFSVEVYSKYKLRTERQRRDS